MRNHPGPVITLVAALLVAGAACSPVAEKEHSHAGEGQHASDTNELPAEQAQTQETELSNEELTSHIIREIDARRQVIEASLSEPVEVASSELREKIRQKWSKIHFYTDNGQVVRIKTYPHAQISQRTEEFYLQQGHLILAVIHDHAQEGTGKKEEAPGKRYYFHDDQLIFEENRSNEAEFNIRESDAEELQTEVKEYLSIFASQQP